MTIYYSCRHCDTQIGKLEGGSHSSSSLGFELLNDQEKQEYITYDDQGHMYVKSICEDCYEMLRRNPDYHALDSFIQ